MYLLINQPKLERLFKLKLRGKCHKEHRLVDAKDNVYRVEDELKRNLALQK